MILQQIQAKDTCRLLIALYSSFFCSFLVNRLMSVVFHGFPSFFVMFSVEYIVSYVGFYVFYEVVHSASSFLSILRSWSLMLGFLCCYYIFVFFVEWYIPCYLCTFCWYCVNISKYNNVMIRKFMYQICCFYSVEAH